ncbi:MAG: LPS export ABC transporter periplasmic protein LptC [Pseudomonadota bacterium]
MTVFEPADGPGRLAHAARPPRTERAFRVARRHRLFVRLLRVFIPGSAVLLLGAFVAKIFVTTLTSVGPIAFESLSLEDGALVMVNPTLTGIDRNERAYSLSAQEASQQLDQTELIDLAGINAVLAVDPQQDAQVIAGNGQFNQEEETLNLFNGVNVRTTTGYEVRLADAFVELDAGRVTSDNAVEIDLLNGTLNATGVEIIERGDIIRFTGPITLDLHMRAQEAAE